MKIIVGLGNPGEKYKNTRHNVGFMVVEKLVTSNKLQVTRKNSPKLVTCYLLRNSAILAKPQTFMNESGLAVKKLVTQYKVNLTDLWVIHDDLDLRLGEYKIQFGVGPKLHYGVQSIEEKLGKKDFWRVRIGVDNREKIQNPKSKIQRISGERYVLQNFEEKEIDTRDKVIGKVVEELLVRVAGRK